MKKPPVSAAQQRSVDLIEQNNLNRWLVRNGYRAYPGGGGRRRVETSGVPRPSFDGRQVNREERRKRLVATRSSSSLGADLLTLGLFMAAFSFGLLGLIWTAIEVLRWVRDLFQGLGG